MDDGTPSLTELDEGDAKAAGIGATASAAVGMALGGPPGAVAGAALGAVRGVAVKKGVEIAAEHLESKHGDPLGLDEPTPAESGAG